MKILILGGDSRQSYAYALLQKRGYQVSLYQSFVLDESMKRIISDSDVIVLPIPVSKDGVHLNSSDVLMVDIINCISKNSVVYGGITNANLKSIMIENHIMVKNLFDFEDFTINNALISAEGALYYVKEKYKGSIYKSRVAVLGFGRIGKILSFYLNAHGSDVSVFARRESDVAWCKLIGFDAYNTEILSSKNNEKLFVNYDIIFNTVPSRLMSEELLKSISADTVILDLASAPYAIDEEVAKAINLNYYRESSIPGRYAPKSAGEIIAITIINDILSRRTEI